MKMSPVTVKRTRKKVTALTVKEALNIASNDIPEADARVLMMHTLDTDAAYLRLMYRDALSLDNENTFFAYVSRRKTGEPCAYITGHREFYGIDFIVTPDVLIPREDTEVLVDLALDDIPKDAPVRVLDLCTGSGCIGLTVAHERPLSDVTLVDVSEKALDVARRNAEKLGINAGFIPGDVLDMPVPDGEFDMIVSNPPYITTEDMAGLEVQVKDFEPHLALCGGDDGLIFYEAIARRFYKSLKCGGRLLFESGDTTDGKAICEKIGAMKKLIAPAAEGSANE